jgi:hypothetical protein
MSLCVLSFMHTPKFFSHIQISPKSQIQLPPQKMSSHLEIFSTPCIQHVIYDVKTLYIF